MLHNFEEVTRDYVRFTAEEFFLLASLFRPLFYEENKFIIEKGQLISDIYFLNSGIIKSYIEKDKEEINVKYYFGPLFFSDLNAILTKRESVRNFVSIKETAVFIAKFEDIKKLNINSKKHESFFNKIFKDHYLF